MTLSPLFRLILALVATNFIFLSGCTKSFASRTFSYQKAKVEINTRIGTVNFHADIADTPKKRSQGLMGRTDIAQDYGMLFVFERPGRHNFWMKDTKTSLDIIFIDKSLKVVGVANNTTPNSLKSIGVNNDSLYVLEVLAGIAKKFGIKEGDTVKITSDN